MGLLQFGFVDLQFGGEPAQVAPHIDRTGQGQQVFALECVDRAGREVQSAPQFCLGQAALFARLAQPGTEPRSSAGGFRSGCVEGSG